MLRTLKNLIYFAIVIGAAIVFWKLYRAAESHESPTPEQRAAQADAQRKQSVAFRLRELEQTNGSGRERLDRDVENAARMLYNSRHGANLPLVK